jgi:hypothetical protein
MSGKMQQADQQYVEENLLIFPWPLPTAIMEFLQFQGSSHVAISADITNDGTEELILHYSSGNAGQIADHPLPTFDAVVVFDFSDNGEISVINSEIFGQDEVSLGGGSRDYDIGDLNRDGFVDIAFALSGDDGRTLLEGQDIDAPLAYGKNSAVLLSSGMGTYEVQILPQVQFWHTVNIIPNSLGLDSVVLADNKSTAVKDSVAFEFVSSSFRYTDEFPHIHNQSAAFIEGEGFDEKDYIVATTYLNDDGSRPALSAYERKDKNWEILNHLEFPTVPADVARNLNSIFNLPIDKTWIEFDDFYVVDFVVWEVSSLSALGNDDLFLAQASGGFVPMDDYPNERKTPEIQFGSLWSTYKILEDQLTAVDAIPDGQDIKTTGFYYQELDINYDGYEDFIVWEDHFAGASSYDAGPPDQGFTIYLNQEGISLYRLPQIDKYEVSISDYSLPRGILLDVNGDFELDLVRFSQNLYWSPEEQILDQAPVLHLSVISDFSAIDTGMGLKVIEGGVEPDNIKGTTTADILYGRGSDDTMVGASGNDLIYGGIGVDTAEYSGVQNSYLLTLSPKVIKITDRRTDGDGNDTLISVELLNFEKDSIDEPFDLQKFGGAYGLTAQDFESFIEFYIAYFNRAPDAVGLNFWGTAFANGTTLEEIATYFIDQEETRATYPEGTSNTDFVTSVYDNVLGRIPDQDGFDFWVDMLNRSEATGVTRDQFILEVLRGVQDGSPDRAYLDTKVDIGAYFAVHKGMSDTDNASAAMVLFDGTQGSVNDAVSAIDGYYQEALDTENGEFLMQVVGVLDNPFA